MLVSFFLFQIGWFACVYLGADYRGEIGAFIMLVLSLGQVALSKQRGRLLGFIVAATLLGSFLDSCLNHFGFFEFMVPSKMPWSYPIWMSALWFGFALVMHKTLGWMAGKPVASALFGFLGGAASYYAGSNLGGIAFPEGILFSLIVIGFFWSTITPFLFWLHRRMGLTYE